MGKETGVAFQVVDGQQRLTTITMILSALSHIFNELNQEDLSKGCYQLVQGKDSDNKPFFKLINETPRPFFQERIQNIKIETTILPNTLEETRLLKAYNLIRKQLSYDLLKEKFKGIQIEETDLEYISLLRAVREQVKALRFVCIIVGDLADANTIFETLNAKGKDLEVKDLIKNEIFTILDDEHPNDSAKTIWEKIKTNIRTLSKNDMMTVFIRHYWLSSFKYTQ